MRASFRNRIEDGDRLTTVNPVGVGPVQTVRAAADVSDRGRAFLLGGKAHRFEHRPAKRHAHAISTTLTCNIYNKRVSALLDLAGILAPRPHLVIGKQIATEVYRSNEAGVRVQVTFLAIVASCWVAQAIADLPYRVFVTNERFRELVVLDPTRDKVSADPEQLALCPDGQRLYVASEDTGAVAVFELASGEKLGRSLSAVSGRESHACW